MTQNLSEAYDQYLGSDEESEAFKEWHQENADDLDLEPLDDDSWHDLISEFRDTQEWTDLFLDWTANNLK